MISFSDSLKRLPTPDGRKFISLFERGTLKIELYAPRGTDPQQPHRQDEVYVVAEGSGEFVIEERREKFNLGDVLFAPAGVPHRFENFSDDFAVWVLFYGPDGGEKS